MRNSYLAVFLFRFLGYFTLLVSLMFTSFQFGPIALAEFEFRKDQLFQVQHQVEPVESEPDPALVSPHPETSVSTSFTQVSKAKEKFIKPVSTDYGIVIEKINANAKVIENVDPTNEKEYVQALAKGVAEAKGSTKPGQNGNLFLFSHSIDAPWNVARYNAIFYLLRELKEGDRIIMFYQGKRFDYIVYDKTIVKGVDVNFLNNRYDKPVLTLQTCDPPGTILNRLVVRAKLAGS